MQTDNRITVVPEPNRPRRGPLVAAAALVVIVIAAILVFRPTDDTPVGGNRPAPQSADAVTTGLPGLPPVAATPSTPETGELVASMWEHVGAPGSFGNGWLYLYDDGRLIWGRLDPTPTDGWLEQRLTPEGVELIRSEIIATGLFDPDQPPPEPRPWSPRETNGGSVQVRNGDRLVYINYVVPELFARLADLWTWLPESAWVDQAPKAYVPSRFAACISGPLPPDDSGPAQAEKHFADLPPEAQDLLTGVARLQMASLVDVDPAGFGYEQDSNEYCFDVTTEEARSLAATLIGPAADEIPHIVLYGFSYVVSGVGRSSVSLTLWPMLPHGVPAFTGA